MISNFKAQNYTGDFSVTEGDYTVTGTFSANASKVMQGCNGTVRDNEDKVLFHFNGWNNGGEDGFAYNFDSVVDIAAFKSALTAFKNAITSVSADIPAAQ